MQSTPKSHAIARIHDLGWQVGGRAAATIVVVSIGLACSTPTTESIVDDCVNVSGSGNTSGDMRTLHGTADFVFDGVVRPAEVGIYWNDLVPRDDGSMDLNIVYQFVWPNGDLLLTNDPVRFVPTLDPNTFDFTLELSVSSGKGMFEPYAGGRLFRLNAEVTIGQAAPGGISTTAERFTIGGRMCSI